ncbi:MAG: radical SAM protein [Elusimicrobiota bacterium]|jgi:threonylcarbamoyladenosine tRNA methylthiotransferase MtaB|nr:radical SAM protein [Elusimicrobiota bacterium]
MKYFIYSFGCKVNQYESRLISQEFKKLGFANAQDIKNADIVVINSCAVTKSAEKECLYLLRKISKFSQRIKILLTGCFAKIKFQEIAQNFPDIEIITDKTKLWTKETLSIFEKRSRAFVKIQDGCDSFCSYCIVPYIRNVLWSKPERDVILEISELVKNGYAEIVLSGIHIGKYEGGLSKIVRKIIEIPLNFRVRISSVELNEIDADIIELMKKYPDKICPHLHIPLQSGSDAILALMNRKYSAKNYFDKTAEILNSIPNFSLTADIISGFPFETLENHIETCKFVEKTSFSRLHIFSYSDREGTKAFSFKKKVVPEEIKRRTTQLLEMDKVKRQEFFSANVGQKRKAVSIGQTKALTDNYIIVENMKPQNGIFEVDVV